MPYTQLLLHWYQSDWKINMVDSREPTFSPGPEKAYHKTKSLTPFVHFSFGFIFIKVFYQHTFT